MSGEMRRGAQLWREVALVFMWLAVVAAALGSHSVTIAWNPNPESGVEYRIHYGEQSGAYDHQVAVGETTTCTLEGLEEGKVYYIAATARADSGEESG